MQNHLIEEMRMKKIADGVRKSNQTTCFLVSIGFGAHNGKTLNSGKNQCERN